MDTQILDTILLTVSEACAGNGSIQGYATSLFGILIAIDFIVAILLNLLSFGGGQNFIGQVITKVLTYGFWLWIIQSWGSLCNVIIDSLSIAGTSFGSLPADVLKHPSDLIDMGIDKAGPLWDFIIAQTSWTSILGSLGIYLLALLGVVGIFTGFALIAIQVFVTYVEFYIASALMLLFIPFATNKYTERFAQNCIGGVISSGVKLMFMGAIISLAGPMIGTIELTTHANPTWETVACVSIVPWAIAFLSWQAPSMAAGFMSGGPALSAGTLASNAMGAASAGTSTAGAAGKVVAAAATGGAAAGAMLAKSGAALAGAAKSGIAGKGDNRTPLGGALRGMGNFVANGAKAMSSVAGGQVKSGLSKSYNLGQQAGSKGIFGDFTPKN